MDAMATIHRVSYPSCRIGLSNEPLCRDWGITDSDQPIQTYSEKN
jgi:hypothetical protein